MNRLIVGCGYVGSEAAKYWLAAGDAVYAVTRSEKRAEELTKLGIQPRVWDWYRSSHEEANSLSLPPIDSVAVCVSHAAVEGLLPQQTHTRGLENLVDFWHGSPTTSIPSHWCYVSTTGVYAPRYDGDWVDEESEVLPMRPGSIAALEAEGWLQRTLISSSVAQGIQQSDNTINVTVLRAAGIYGPGRIPRLDSLRNNEALTIDPESYLNLIHVADLAGIIVAASEASTPYRVLNVADGSPVRRRDYYDYIAQEISSPPPRFEAATNPYPNGLRTRGEGSKRINTERLRHELNYRFQYPNYQVGLKPLLV